MLLNNKWIQKHYQSAWAGEHNSSDMFTGSLLGRSLFTTLGVADFAHKTKKKKTEVMEFDRK